MLYTINYSHTVLSYKMDEQLNRENHRHQPVKKELSYRKPLDAKKSERKMEKNKRKEKVKRSTN